MLTQSTSRTVHLRRLVAGLVALAAVVLALLAPQAFASTSGTTGLSTVRLAAGHRVVDHYKRVWTSDRAYASGGSITHTTRHIRGTRTQALFATERAGRFTYRIPVAPGYYRVTLSMAEHVFRHAGQRVFAVTAQGVTRVSRLDPVARAGQLRAYSTSFNVRVTNHLVTLGLRPLHHGATLSSVSVIGYQHLPTPKPSSPPRSSPTTKGGSSTPAPPVTTTPAPPVTTPAPTPTPVPTPTPTPMPTPNPTPAKVVTPEMFGAVGNGVHDDTAALQSAFDNANGLTVMLPAGHIYAHSNLLHLRTTGLHVSGPGELLATNEKESSVWIEADNVLVDGGVLIKTGSTTQRWGTWDQMGVRLVGHSGITMRDVTVDGSAAAGVYVGGATHGFVLDHVTVQNTRADGIHMTESSYGGSVVSPRIVNSGDDGVAVVSYKQDGTPCHDITVTSPTVIGTVGGRGLSVVGGTHITETNVDVERTSAAGIYLGAEGNPWYTAAASNVTISGGRIVGANTDTSVDHGAVVVLSGESDVTPNNLTVTGLTITSTRSTASRDLGVITYGATPSTILFSNITITGGPTPAYSGNTAQSAYALRNIVQNGVRLPDAG